MKWNVHCLKISFVTKMEKLLFKSDDKFAEYNSREGDSFDWLGQMH